MARRNPTEASFLYELARNSETTELVAYLKRSDDPVIRARAAELLGDFSDVPQEQRYEELVRELVNAVIHDDSDKVRAMAIDSLYRHGQDSLERLIDELSERDVRDAPDWVIAETLLEWLDAEQAEFRLVAATALGDIGDEHVIPALLSLFDDPDARVRMRAVRSTGILGDSRCIEPLQKMLEDRRKMVRREAAHALANIGSERALEALVPVVRDADEELRRVAVGALGQFTSLKPLVVLVHALRDNSPAVKRTAAVSLIELFATAPTQQGQELRETIADQLERADSVEVVPPMLDVLEGTRRNHIRRQAIWLLGRVTDDEQADAVLDALIDTLDNDDEVSAQLAAETLIELSERVESDELEKDLRLYVQNEDGSEEAIERAEYVIDEISPDVESELVTNSVEYTFIRNPEDYTRKKQNEKQHEE